MGITNGKLIIGLEAVLGIGATAVTALAVNKLAKLERQREIYKLEFEENKSQIEAEERRLDEKKESAEKEFEELKAKTDELLSKKKFIYDHEAIIIDGASKMRNAVYSKDDKMRDDLLDEGYNLIDKTLNDIRREIEFKKKFPTEVRKYNWLNETRSYIIERTKLSDMTEEAAMAEITLTEREKELLRWMLQA